jgi:hypothetical protein
MARRNQTVWLLVFTLAVALLWYWQHRPSTPRVIPQPNLETFNGCGMEGDASSPAVRELNLLKNRYTAPEPQEIDPRVTLAAMLEPGDDRTRWNDHHAAEITGYLWDVKVGGVETVNCHASDPPERDTHIELVLDPRNGSEDRRVIVEVTPAPAPSPNSAVKTGQHPLSATIFTDAGSASAAGCSSTPNTSPNP